MNILIFNQAGVNYLQAHILGLSMALLLIEMNEIRTDFDSWLNKWFNLTTSQLSQLQNMDPAFKQELANAIANNYAAGLTVNFIKEDKDEQEVPDKKTWWFMDWTSGKIP
ncbi:hypothetical protein [Sphingobacterium sp. IITKGP-BTPF85]|uniref:hypothetical protein n=1 Tax=Sphingobacterium sp. IITKGP-BTPF85 TaxID=1338009 RepID=UPI00038A1367|nr:hypothetical protein [Sphingobacterium sp. IITKGP-BTPF85]KKX51130.1 hypothetical protein L950_0206360 [Sphingobacterium sp. IITKGP-BTPF85]